MADYLVTDTDLTDVANAIREKGGTSAALEWPSGYVSAIGDIETGGGVELASVSLYSIDTFMPSHIYYTDENMEVQHETSGVVENTLMPVGSIVFCYGNQGPNPFANSNVGITSLYSDASPKSLYAAYEVTG